MKADVRFSEDGNKILLEMGTGDFIDFAKDLELAHRATGGVQFDIEKFLHDLRNGFYEELKDVARDKIIESKEYELESIERARDSMEQVAVLVSQL